MRKLIMSSFLAVSLLGGGAAFASPGGHAPEAPQAFTRFAPPSRNEKMQTSLGEVMVGGRRSGKATLDVERGQGRLTSLSLLVKRGDLGAKIVRVVFGNGQDLITRISGRYAVIDLPGDARNVRSIEISAAGFVGRRGDRALVEVQGTRSIDRIAFPRHAMR